MSPDLNKKTPVQQLAVVVEEIQAARDDEAVTRMEVARLLESDRKLHNIELEKRLKEQARRISQRFLVVFTTFILITALLAYRTEINANELRKTQVEAAAERYNACLVRVDRQVFANVGRETLVQLAAGRQADPVLKAQAIQQLRDGLLLPIENCGEPPP